LRVNHTITIFGDANNNNDAIELDYIFTGRSRSVPVTFGTYHFGSRKYVFGTGLEKSFKKLAF